MTVRIVETEVASQQVLDVSKSRSGLDQALALANEVGWRRALEVAFEGSADFIRYITDETRLSLLKILPLAPSKSVLEIGPGFGQMTVALSRRVGLLDAIEADQKQAKFCSIRAKQENCNNVRVFAGGVDASLPFKDATYNLVIMNLVFEWCAIRSSEPHELVQGRYLKEIHRILVPGGHFFISTKNRYGLRLLFGSRDEHMSNMRFGSCLPRTAGRMLMGGKRQDGYLYSKRAIVKRLSEAGFTDPREFVGVPDARWANSYVTADAFKAHPSAYQLIRGPLPKRARYAARILPTSVLLALTQGISILAEKPSAPAGY